MASTKDMIIAGDYKGKGIINVNGDIQIALGFIKCIHLNKDTVESYEVINEESRKSAASGIARGAIGAALLGPVGLLAGLSAKNAGTVTVAIKLKDGKNSLIEMSDKNYKAFTIAMF